MPPPVIPVSSCLLGPPYPRKFCCHGIFRKWFRVLSCLFPGVQNAANRNADSGLSVIKTVLGSLVQKKSIWWLGVEFHSFADSKPVQICNFSTQVLHFKEFSSDSLRLYLSMLQIRSGKYTVRKTQKLISAFLMMSLWLLKLINSLFSYFSDVHESKSFFERERNKTPIFWWYCVLLNQRRSM